MLIGDLLPDMLGEPNTWIFLCNFMRGFRGGCTFLAKTFNSSLNCPKFSKKSQSADIGLMCCRCVRVTLLTVMSL